MRLKEFYRELWRPYTGLNREDEVERDEVLVGHEVGVSTQTSRELSNVVMYGVTETCQSLYRVPRYRRSSALVYRQSKIF